MSPTAHSANSKEEWMKPTLLATQRLADRRAITGALLLTAALLSSHAYAERKYSDWSPAVNLGCTVNSAAQDLGPAISKDGLSLYFGSARAAPGAQGGSDLYVSQRPSHDAPWGLPQNLGPVVNTAVTDNIPSLSRDGHLLFFNSNRGGGFGDVDLWVSFREDVHDDFAWGAPVNVGPGVNSAGFDAGAGYFENDEGGAPLLFFGRGASQATQETTTDIFVSERQPDGSFGPARMAPELSGPTGDQRPIIRFDGLEIFFTSNRPGSTPDALGNPTRDIWVAHRNSVNEPWGIPENLGPTVNTGFTEVQAYISADGRTLFFSSDRPGGCGAADLYMSTRTKLTGKDRQGE
jgi:WD40 repeat protein